MDPAGASRLETPDVTGLVVRAQQGDGMAREEILESYRSFAAAVASRQAGRSLDPSNDDELSVALLALNEAIDAYKPELGVPFQAFAVQVIRHRIIDYQRKQKKSQHVPLEIPDRQDEGDTSPAEERQAWQSYQQEVEVRERAEELLRYEEALSRYGISLDEMEEVCPKHRDTRQNLIRIARLLAERADLRAKLTKSGLLPIAELQRLTGASRKVLETGRKYIIAVALILMNDEFEQIRGFLDLTAGDGGD